MIEKLIQRVLDYAQDIVEGNIKAGKKHIQACQRFLNDIENLQSENSPFYFDGTELEQFYEWARMFKHKKGVLVGKPIELTDFQLFIAANLFCFKWKETGYRRFQKAYIQLGRKNAKSQLLAILATYIAFLSDQQEEVYIAGWSRDQSKLVYNEILNQIRGQSILNGKYSDSYGKITHLKSGSIIEPLSREARKLGDGKNPSVGIIDEYHAHETSEIYDVIDSGMGARPNPLLAIITTAGFDLASPCYKEYDYVSKVIDPAYEAENEEYFVLICELDPDDDVKDESNWIKANPIVATYPEGVKRLKSDLNVAVEQPEKMRNFLTKRMNRWVDQKENGYMSLKRWKESKGELPDLRGKTVYVGFDLSATNDLTSVAFVFPHEGKFYVKGHSFIPEDRMREKIQMDKQPYDSWADQGLITPTPGSIIDYREVEAHILDTLSDLTPSYVEICYDRWNAAHLAQRLENQGLTVVEIPQSIRHLSLPTKNFREKVYDGKVVHENDPVIYWAMSNAILKMDDQENIMISKKVSKDRIDPVAAIINAFARAMHDENNINLNDYILSEEFSL